jgi:hypothetical protein
LRDRRKLLLLVFFLVPILVGFPFFFQFQFALSHCGEEWTTSVQRGKSNSICITGKKFYQSESRRKQEEHDGDRRREAERGRRREKKSGKLKLEGAWLGLLKGEGVPGSIGVRVEFGAVRAFFSTFPQS